MYGENQIGKTAIYDLIINSKEFEQLNVEINKFNPFNVLQIAKHEIRHSNVLAWLIDPQKNHNLSDKIFKKLILYVLHNPENEESIPDSIHIQNIQRSDFSDAKILREWRHIDLLAVSESNKFILLIENKIHTSESRGQLNRYFQICNDHFPDYNVLPVFLTLDGAIPTSEKYCILDYSKVYDVILFVSRLYRERMASDVNNFIHHYLKTLGGLLAMDEEIKKLCLDIYKEHKDVIDIIHDIGNAIDIEPAIDSFKKKYPNIIETFRNNKAFWFAVPEFHKTRKMEHDWGGGYPISFWFSEYYGKLKLILEIGPFDDGEERVRFLNHLENSGIHTSDRTKEPGRKYSRLITDTKKVEDWSDKEEILDAMFHLYNLKKMVKVKKKLVEALNTFDW